MHEQATLSRRALAALPIVALAGAAVAAPAALPALPSTDAARIDTAANRCRAARQAFDRALDDYERALPRPHFTLDMTNRKRWSFHTAVERRLFDGKAPKRVINPFGIPAERYVATVETIEQDLYRCPPEDRDRRRLLYRMRRRAKAREAKTAALEASFRLQDLSADVDEAEHALNEAMQELFSSPATSMAAVLVQAKALSAYTDTISEQYATFQAGRYGTQLAAGLLNVARVS